MTIATLQGLKEINGKKIMTNDERPLDADGNVDWEAFDKMREEFPICIDHENDMISFKMLTKPESEGGNLKLCQLTEPAAIALEMLQVLNNAYPCRHNFFSILKLEEFLMWQKARTEDRQDRGVEGKNEE